MSALTSAVLMAMGTAQAAPAKVDNIADAITQGTTKVDLNLRYEGVQQDNASKDADALTLRTRLTLATAQYNGLSALVEFEDSRNVAGVNDYNDTNGNNPDYSVIADPNTTELDQAFLQYQRSGFKARVGRQMIALGNQRFVGHVGWRQDRQTFDGLTMQYAFNDAFEVDYGYLTKRNRIFAEAKDVDAKDHIFNASYKLGFGKVTGYGYLLEEDKAEKNGIDTYGINFEGSTKVADAKILYKAEYASQESTSAAAKYDADYLALEAGAGIMGYTVKAGYEKLGSDDGMYGFSTPLATLHKFNGWSDQFLGTPKEGLVDIYASVGGSLMSAKWTLAYHKFDADKASATVDDLGSEIDASVVMPINKNYLVGVKYAKYSAGDSTAGKVDTDKVWLWANAKF
ncbi:alginate export family protein [Shewanella intestini]|uniref:Alginate export family protein n=2 Tax=Shewanellaceae TaxID=267890 RepID=A0ABS5HXQ6_9GAMM|nr:alginate export family protein [Shewanella intestini]MRG34894.1 hypothetical protein [Shewanella sp. XMDDZSB0408]